MSYIPRVVVFAVVWLAQTACGRSAAHVPVEDASPEGRALVTSADRYTLRVTEYFYEGAIPFRFTNRMGRPVAVPGCPPPTPPALERWDGRRRRWAEAYPVDLLACSAPPLVIPAGATREDTLRIRVFRPGIKGAPQFAVPPERVPGSRYRLLWHVNEVAPPSPPPYPSGPPIPAAERTSNSFYLDVQR